jgi:hypothetical protein
VPTGCAVAYVGPWGFRLLAPLHRRMTSAGRLSWCAIARTVYQHRGQPAPHHPGQATTATPAPLPALVDLLTTWQLWTYRDHLTQQIAQACRVNTLSRQLITVPSVTAVEALSANHQLTTLLLGGAAPRHPSRP